MNYKRAKAFTLVEIMIVCVILGILTTLALPLYQKTMDTARQNNAKVQLQAIWAANQIYHTRFGKYWPQDEGKWIVDDINAKLNLNIVSNNIEYRCLGVSNGTTFLCVAYLPPEGINWCFKMTEAPLSDTNPQYYSPGNSCM